MMTVVAALALVSSRYDPAATCLVCGGLIEAGEGLSARYQGRLLRFRCDGCVDRFRADPESYLAGHRAGCCSDHAESPASEWCD